jgi:3-deoxy-D-manno-octulosonic-acid transferase
LLPFALYNLLLPFGLLCMLPGAIVKMRRRGGRWRDLAQRIGLHSRETQAAIEALPRDQGRLWMHAVSVGEVNVAQKLIKSLLLVSPDTSIVLTSTTPTGHALAKECEKQHAGRVVALYSPIDLPGVPRRMIEVIRPTQLVLVEAEVWPNLVRTCSLEGIPVSLVNARLSPRSARRLKALSFLVRPVYGLLQQILVQETDDVARWQSFGLDASLIHLTGSVKYDPEGSEVPAAKIDTLRQILHERGIEAGRPVLLAASTHDGEEVQLAKVFQKIKARHPQLALLIVPRHVERAAEIVADLQTIGLHAALRSQEGARVDEGACLLIDTTGELAAWQHLATLVIIGKSFLAEGGQNPAEAVFAGKPVLFGPHMENFTPLVDLLLRHRGAMQVRDFDDLEKQLDNLLKSPGDLARNGQQALQVHAGATRRTVERVLGV